MFPDVTPRHDPPRLLLAVAHPDDETFGCGSTLLHAAARGWETTVVCATRGEAGEPAPGVDLGGRPLAELREEELRSAAARSPPRWSTSRSASARSRSTRPRPRRSRDCRTSCAGTS